MGIYSEDSLSTLVDKQGAEKPIIKNVIMIDAAGKTIATNYSLNIPTFDVRSEGSTIGIPSSVGVGVNLEGVSINGNLGIDLLKMKLRVGLDISAELNNIMSANAVIGGGYQDTTGGVGLDVSVDPRERIKAYLWSNYSIENEEIQNKKGAQIRTGVLGAIILIVYSASCCARTGQFPQDVWNKYVESCLK